VHHRLERPLAEQRRHRVVAAVNQQYLQYRAVELRLD
jgi:hypothetical protein